MDNNDQLSYDELNDALEEMKSAIESIREAVLRTTFSDFLDDRPTVRAVLEGFDLLTVNVGKIPREVRDDYPEVAWRELDNLSAYLSDEFHEVDLDAVWDAANDLDPLLDVVSAILARLDEYC